MGVQPGGVPLPSDAKQYHGILRRRQCRAKAESENKLKSRKVYHEFCTSVALECNLGK